MPFPEFVEALPAIDVPFSDDVVQTAAVRSDAGLVVFFTFLKDMEIPPHAHLGQWGTVIEGEVELTMNGETRAYQVGESYTIAAGVEHSVRIKAGTRAIDFFEEPDRYPLRG